MSKVHFLSVLLLALFLAAPGLSQEVDSTYQERLEYDPATGHWNEVAPPIPGTEEGDLALARSLLAQGEYKMAREAFATWFKVYPESPHWPEALFYAAETEVSAEDQKPKHGHLIKAYDWLEELLNGWPGTDLADRAVRKELIIAEMLLFKERKQKVWGGLFWLSGEEEALTMLDRVIDERAPGSPIAEQALRLKADYHYLSGDFEESETAYARLMREFPRGRYAKFSLLRAGESALARFPGVEFDEADLLEAEVYFQDFQQKYPTEAEEHGIPQQLSGINDRRAEKDFKVGQYYERVREIDAAAFYYRLVMNNWAATTWAAQARSRLEALGAIEPVEAMPEDEMPSQAVDGADAAAQVLPDEVVE